MPDQYKSSSSAKTVRKKNKKSSVRRDRLNELREKIKSQDIKHLDVQDENDKVGNTIVNEFKDKLPEGVSQAMLDMAECPCCKEFYIGEIYQCNKGHMICGFCLDKINNEGNQRCPTCRERYTSKKIRSIAYESIISSFNIKIKCPYHEFGCDAELQYGNVKNHLSKCKVKPNQCPIYTQNSKNECQFKYRNINLLAEHFVKEHQFRETLTPHSDFIQIPIHNICKYRAKSLESNMIHKYQDDYLWFTCSKYNSYNYNIRCYSLNNNYYVINTTIQTTNIPFTNQQEFISKPFKELNLPLKEQKKSNFSKLKYFTSANFNDNVLTELSNYTTSTLNITIRPPTVNELEQITKIDSNTFVKLMDEPSEPTLTEEEVCKILGEDIETPRPSLKERIIARRRHNRRMRDEDDEDDEDDDDDDDMVYEEYC